MKKVILALAIVSVSFVACNSGDTKTETTKDTTTVIVPPAAPAAPDTMMVVKDTTVKTTTKIDTLKKK